MCGRAYVFASSLPESTVQAPWRALQHTDSLVEDHTNGRHRDAMKSPLETCTTAAIAILNAGNVLMMCCLEHMIGRVVC